MIKYIALLTPIYVTLFWSILLNSSKKGTPQAFLGKFMLFALFIYCAHCRFFIPGETTLYIDPIYQYVSLMVFPMFHIYIRLLTIDRTFSFKIHWKYLITPTILFIFDYIAMCTLPKESYREFVLQPNSKFIFPYIITILMKITYIGQVIYYITANQILIHKHAYKARDFYSDIRKISPVNIISLNIVMIIIAIASIIISILGRAYFYDNVTGLVIISVIFSSTLFIIGQFGYAQNVLNPTYEDNNMTDVMLENTESTKLPENKRNELKHQLEMMLNEKRIYLQADITINDLSKSMGTNRSYLSQLINIEYGKNFCALMNDYRVTEVEKRLKSEVHYKNMELVSACGFGSMDSLKRAVFNKTGVEYTQWKAELQKKEQ